MYGAVQQEDPGQRRLTNEKATSYAESGMGIVEEYDLGEIVGQPTSPDRLVSLRLKKYYAKRRSMRRLPKRLKQMFYPLMEKFYLPACSTASPGTKKWLIGTEIKYGGYVTYVPRNKVSPKDPRTKDQISIGGMTGGDRMLHHGYATKYATYLRPYMETNRMVTLVECGILKGTGLAIWCDLFVGGRIIGLDIDLEHVKNNMDNLRALGAFKSNQPELYIFDQFKDNSEYIGAILNGDKIDVFIDDGFHSIESILSTMNSVLPNLAYEAVYFIEDNRDVYKEIKTLYPDLLVDYKDELTIVSKRALQSA